MLCKISYLANFSKILAKLTKTELNSAKIIGELSVWMGESRNWRGKWSISSTDGVLTPVGSSGTCPCLGMLLSFGCLIGTGPGLEEIKVGWWEVICRKIRVISCGCHCCQVFAVWSRRIWSLHGHPQPQLLLEKEKEMGEKNVSWLRMVSWGQKTGAEHHS